MAHKGLIKPTSIDNASGVSSIVPTSAINDEEFVFSYKYLDLQHEYFGVGHKEVGYFIGILERMKIISGMSFRSLKGSGSAEKDVLRFHAVDFSSGNVSVDGLGVKNKKLMADECTYQFSISKATGRLIGFLVGNIFYVRWIDSEHNLYPMRGISKTWVKPKKDAVPCVEANCTYVKMLDGVTKPEQCDAS